MFLPSKQSSMSIGNSVCSAQLVAPSEATTTYEIECAFTLVAIGHIGRNDVCRSTSTWRNNHQGRTRLAVKCMSAQVIHGTHGNRVW
jgi:hypothetical protein